jgi:hypothetical protein
MAERQPPADWELEAALRDLGARLDYPPPPPLAATVAEQLRVAPRPSFWRRPLARRLALAGLTLLLLLGLTLTAWPEARAVVAERLGLNGLTITFVPAVPTPTPTATPAPTPQPTPTPAPPGARLQLGRLTSLEEARALTGAPAPVPTLPELGQPDAVYVSERPARSVALVYGRRPGLPVAGETGVSLLVVQITGAAQEINEGFLGKGLGPGTRLEEVRVNGERGYWIEGAPHFFFYLDAAGQARQETIRLAANVLVWEQDGRIVRLEGALSREQALRIAGTMSG